MKRLLVLMLFSFLCLTSMSQSLTGQCFRVDSISSISEDHLGPWDYPRDTCWVYAFTDTIRISAPLGEVMIQMVQFDGKIITTELGDIVPTYVITVTRERVCFMEMKQLPYSFGSLNTKQSWRGLFFSHPSPEE